LAISFYSFIPLDFADFVLKFYIQLVLFPQLFQTFLLALNDLLRSVTAVTVNG